jgi:macrolide transport system ATP-binding/permease protein
VKNLSAQVSGRVQVTSSFGKNWSTQVQGNNSSWETMHSAKPAVGRFFTEDENAKRSRVAVIGETVRSELFGKPRLLAR